MCSFDKPHPFRATKKARRFQPAGFVSGNVKLHSAGDLAAAQAAGAGVNMLRFTVYNGLDALHVRLPGTIGTSVRMAHFNAERNVLVAKLTFCHAEAPPCLCLAAVGNGQLIYNSRRENQMQDNFSIF